MAFTPSELAAIRQRHASDEEDAYLSDWESIHVDRGTLLGALGDIAARDTIADLMIDLAPKLKAHGLVNAVDFPDGVPETKDHEARAEEAERLVAAMKLRALDAHAAVFRAMQAPPEEQAAALRDDGYVHQAVHAILAIPTPMATLEPEVQRHIDELGARALRAEQERDAARARIAELEAAPCPSCGDPKGERELATIATALKKRDEAERRSEELLAEVDAIEMSVTDIRTFLEERDQPAYDASGKSISDFMRVRTMTKTLEAQRDAARAEAAAASLIVDAARQAVEIRWNPAGPAALASAVANYIKAYDAAHGGKD